MIRRILKKRRRGVMAMVAIAGMVPVTAMMSANLNTSQMVNDRRIVQDGADALATMHGAWSARALNVISMNNVTTAQLMTVAVGSEALVAATVELGAAAALATGHIQLHNAQHCPPRQPNNPLMWVPEGLWFVYCEAIHIAVNVPAVAAAAKAVYIFDHFKPAHGVDTATKALEAIEGMNQALRQRHPIAMAEIGEDYASALGLTDLHFADPCQDPDLTTCRRTTTNHGMGLPLEEESGLSESFMEGLNLGSDAGSGILGSVDNKYLELYVLMNIGTTGVNTGFAARGFPQGKGPVTSGGKGQTHVREHINGITEIGDTLNAFQHFYSNRNSDLPRYPFGSSPPPQNPPRNSQPRQDGGSGQPFDPGTDTEDQIGIGADNLLGGEGEAIEAISNIAGTASELVQKVLEFARNMPFSYDHHPAGARLLTMPQDTAGPNSFTRAFDLMHLLVAVPEVRNNSAGLLAPVPTMWRLPEMSTPEALTSARPEEMPDPFRILAYGLRDKSPRLSSAVLTSPVESHTGYGQVGLYNPDGASLYAQNWQHRLMAATRMDNAQEAGQNLNRQAHSSFGDLAKALSAVTSPNNWRRVHAH